MNPDAAVKALSPQIATLRKLASARVQSELKRLGAFVPPMNAGRLTSAEIAFWIRIAAQADSLPAETLATLEENLLVIDEAVQGIRAALDSDPGNPSLVRLLLATRQKEMDFLGTMVRLANES